MRPVADVYAASEVSAQAAILMEYRTFEVLYEKNAYEKRSMASTTKIMTTLLTLESGDLDKPFQVDSDAIHVEGSSMGLREGDIVTKRALCYGMMLPSGNDAANASAVAVAGSIPAFAKRMNARAAQIGMTRTCFVTPSGLEGEGHGASAYDMALLTREALENPDFRAICGAQSVRLKFGYPPYSRIIDICLDDPNPKRLALMGRLLSDRLAAALRPAADPDSPVRVEGPFSPGEGRLVLRVILAKDRSFPERKKALKEAVDAFVAERKYTGFIHVDVDPD